MARPPTIYGRARTIVGYPGEYNSGIGMPGAGSIWQTLTRYDRFGRPLFTRDGSAINYPPTGFSFNNLVWVVDQLLSGPSHPVVFTLLNGQFNVAESFTNGASQIAAIQFHGTMTYDGPPVVCNLHVVVSDVPSGGSGFTYGIDVDVDGNSVMSFDYNSNPSPGTYDFPFTIPTSSPGLITITSQGFFGLISIGPVGSGTVNGSIVGTFTP